MLVDTVEQWSYFAVFILAAIPWIELAVVIPIGIIIGLHPVMVAGLSFLGNWLTVFLLTVLFDRFQQWRASRKGVREAQNSQIQETDFNHNDVEWEKSKRGQRAERIWHRYGLPGLTLIAPIITGTHIAAAVAMAFKAPKQWVLVWMTISLLVWTLILTLGVHYGFGFLGTR